MEQLTLFDIEPSPCTNCDGRKCMSCIFREIHDECQDDCPMCCPGFDEKNEHAPSVSCMQVHCHSHNLDEPARPGEDFYRCCLECGHLFRTAQELLDAHNKMIRENNERWGDRYGLILLPKNVSEIFSCPYCSHDF